MRLPDAFRLAFPDVTYYSHSAKCYFLQLPIATLTLGKPESGQSEVYLLEYSSGMNYSL